MAAPSALRQPPGQTWTVADLHRKVGPIPFERIRQNPPPGCGTVADVVRIHDHEDRLYELVDAIRAEKTTGYEYRFLDQLADRPRGQVADRGSPHRPCPRRPPATAW